MRRTPSLQFRPASEAVHKLVQASRCQTVSARAGEKRIVVPDTASMAQPDSEGLASSSTNGNESLSATLPKHATPTLNKVHVTNPQGCGLANANACVQ